MLMTNREVTWQRKGGSLPSHVVLAGVCDLGWKGGGVVLRVACLEGACVSFALMDPSCVSWALDLTVRLE